MNTHEPDGYLVGGFNEKYVQVKLGSSEPQDGMNIKNVWVATT